MCQTRGDEKLLILTLFSRLGVLVNPYPFGMVITVNQNRKKTAQKENFICLPSRISLTLMSNSQSHCDIAAPCEFDFLSASNKAIKPSGLI